MPTVPCARRTQRASTRATGGASLWTPRAERRGRVQPRRRRRECLGELVHIDGCDHEWFEACAPRCVLLVFVDDATGRLMELQFCTVDLTNVVA